MSSFQQNIRTKIEKSSKPYIRGKKKKLTEKDRVQKSNLAEKDFKADIINIFKELIQSINKEVKKG